MDLDEIRDAEKNLVNDVRRNCKFCAGRAHLSTNRGEPEKKEVLKDLKELYNVYENKFHALRKSNGSVQSIQNAGDNKRFILDTTEMCEHCDREIDNASRAMLKLK